MTAQPNEIKISTSGGSYRFSLPINFVRVISVRPKYKERDQSNFNEIIIGITKNVPVDSPNSDLDVSDQNIKELGLGYKAYGYAATPTREDGLRKGNEIAGRLPESLFKLTELVWNKFVKLDIEQKITAAAETNRSDFR